MHTDIVQRSLVRHIPIPFIRIRPSNFLPEVVTGRRERRNK